MSLGKYIIPVQFTGGIDQKTPEKLLPIGRFVVLENCVRRKIFGVQKRYGFSSLSADISDGGSISEGRKVANFNDDLLLFGANEFYSYTPSSDEWVPRGSVSSVLVDSNPIVRNGDLQAMPDIAHTGGLTISAWEDSRGGIRMTLTDDETGAALIYDVEISATGSRPKCVALGDYLIVTYYDGGDFNSVALNRADPTAVGAPVTIAADIEDAPYDIDAVTDRFAVFAYNNTSDGLTIGYMFEDGSLGGNSQGLPTPVTIGSATSLGTEAITVKADYANDRFYVLYYDSATSTDLTLSSYRLDLIITDTATIETIADVRNVTCAVADNQPFVFYEISDTDPFNHFVRFNTFTWDGNASTNVGTPDDFKRSVGLAAKAFTVGTYAYVTLVHESTLQPTYFTVRDDGLIVTRMLGSVSGGLTRDTSLALKPGLSRTILDSDARYTAAFQIRNKLTAQSDGTILSTNRNIQRLSLSFGASTFDTDTLGLNLHIAGGTMQSYDGVSATEQGFHLYPENIGQSATSGGSLAAGDYSYRVLYEWIDATGQIHRSTASVTQTQTATLNQKIVLTIPTLRLTAKTAPRAEVKVVIYVAAVGLATVYYRHGEVVNDVTTDSVSYEITAAASPTAEILYTTGGVYDNDAPPACKVVHKHKNRLFVAGLEDGNRVGYSKEYVQGEGVAFSDFLFFRVDPTGGDVRALATLDDKLILFKKDRAFYQVGDGPLDTGAQNDFGIPQAISGDIGCSTPQSIVNTPQGVMFKSDKGIYLLSRGLRFEYVGSPVEDYNNLTITSAVVVEDVDEVRFTTAEGPTLVYNYLFNQWSTFLNYDAVSAVNALNTYIHLKADGRVNKEVASQYHDNGSRIQMGIETSWIATAGIQGYQRIYRFALLGDFLSHHITRVKLAYDYENVYNETIYFNTVTGLQQTIFGDDTVFGDETPMGGNGSSVYQFRCKPRRQKCQSFKLRIEDLDTIEEHFGPCFTFLTLTLEVGRKTGITKMGASKTVGSG